MDLDSVHYADINFDPLCPFRLDDEQMGQEGRRATGLRVGAADDIA
jgi:hypothetical protein